MLQRTSVRYGIPVSKLASGMWIVLCIFWLDTSVEHLRAAHAEGHPVSWWWLRTLLWSAGLVFWTRQAWLAWRRPRPAQNAD